MLKKWFRLSTLFVMLCLSSSLFAQDAKEKFSTTPFNITIVETTDVHGMIFPYNYITDRAEPNSMAHVSTFVNNLRRSGKEVLLLDGGDSLQGQPTVYYYNFEKTNASHIWADVLNYMNYDAVAIANHDIEAGHAVYDRWAKETKAPLLAANLVDEKTGKPYFEAYTIIEKQGVKIAILGLIEPGIDRQLPKVLYSGMKTLDMIDTAKKWVPIIMKNEKPDVLIGLFHAGVDYTYGGVTAKTKKNENASQLVAEQVEGFDVIIVGHDHQGWSGTGYDEATKAKTKIIKSPKGRTVPIYGGINATRQIVSIELSMKWNATANAWEKEFTGGLVNTSNLTPDAAFIRAFATQEKEIRDWVNRPIGTLSTALSADQSLFGDSEFMSLIHKLQFEIAKEQLGITADVSFAAPLNMSSRLNAGTVRVRDMFSLYQYENFFYVMTLTGKQIKDVMEYSYANWFNTMKTPQDHLIAFSLDPAGKPIYNERYQSYSTKVNPYNYESFAGVNYTVDVTKPEGQRVTITTMADGSAFVLNKKYNVAINSYRASGGGRHLSAGAKIPEKTLQDMKLVQVASDKDLRFYMMKWFEAQRGSIAVAKINNWKPVPEDLVEAGKKTDYPLLYPPR